MSEETKIENAGFERNFRKLEVLSQELQQNRVTIDELVPRMKEALGAIKICKEVLKATKSQLKEISSEFEDLEAEPQGE